MKLFGQIVRTLVNTAVLPVAIVKDVVTLGGVATGEAKPYTECRRCYEERSGITVYVNNPVDGEFVAQAFREHIAHVARSHSRAQFRSRL